MTIGRIFDPSAISTWTNMRAAIDAINELDTKLLERGVPARDLRAEYLRADMLLCGAVLVQMVVHPDGGMAPFNTPAYRIAIANDGQVNLIHLDTFTVDPLREGIYDDVNALPNWVQERIAILMMTSATPPTHEVEGIGRRIAKNVFWVYAPNAK